MTNSKLLVSLAHVILVGPWLAYVGLAKPSAPLVYHATLGLGAVMTLWLLLKAVQWPSRALVFLVHALLFGPLLVYVGLKQLRAKKDAFLLLALIGILATLYHAWKLYRMYSSVKK